MTSAKTSPAGPGGYWTIEIVNRDRDQIGRRYLCHARDDAEAKAMAGHLAGSSKDVVGYDYHRIDSPYGQYASSLPMGGSESIDNLQTWTALHAPPQRD